MRKEDEFMQRTKIGISAGLLGAGIYFTGLFSGYLIPIILTFYVLWFEENGWLRRTAVKAVSVIICKFVSGFLRNYQ